MLPDLNNKHKAIIIGLIIVILSIIGLKDHIRQSKTIYVLSDEELTDSDEFIEPKQIIDNTIIVHIEGEVKTPGIYTLLVGARVFDAVEAAGGLNSLADRKRVNLAKKIADEEFIYIPSEEDDFQEVQPVSGSLSGGMSNGLININTADTKDFETLPGIGPTIANRIIEYREQIGRFKNIEDIQNVSGIGEKKYADIKNKITM